VDRPALGDHVPLGPAGEAGDGGEGLLRGADLDVVGAPLVDRDDAGLDQLRASKNVAISSGERTQYATRRCRCARRRRLSGNQKAVDSAHARQRGPGERADAQLKSQQILRKIRCCPHRATSPGLMRVPGQELVVHHAEPGSASEPAVQRVAKRATERSEEADVSGSRYPAARHRRTAG
jgi:hypothetical protein